MHTQQAKLQNTKKKGTTAQMDLVNQAICYAMRNPPRGKPKMAYKDIMKMVAKTDGSKPTVAAMCLCAQNFKKRKGQRGRPEGSNKTSKAEDKVLLDTFKKLRPPGHGVTSRRLHKALPKKISKKMSQRTCRRRLADKGYTPEKNSPSLILVFREPKEECTLGGFIRTGQWRYGKRGVTVVVISKTSLGTPEISMPSSADIEPPGPT